MTMFSKRTFSILLTMISVGCVVASANNVYVSQNATGLGNGQDCANTKAASYLNNSTYWVSSAPIETQIGPGTVVHLCGTFTGNAGSSALVVRGSGTSAQPITILFEPGAQLNAPYWGGFPMASCPACSGAITVNGFNYITIDGGSGGVIQNTANGTGLPYQHDSLGLYLNGNNIIVRNLAIQNIYANLGASTSATDSGGTNTADIRVDNGSSNISISNSTLLDARAGIWSDTSGTNINYNNNTIADHCWQIVLTGSGSQNVHDNDISDYTNWQYPTGAYHTDGVIAFGDSSVLTPQIYNNYFHGDLGAGSPTGFVFCTYGTAGNGSGSSCTIFNNLFVGTGYSATHDAAIYFHSGSGTNALGPHSIYNNTFSGFQFHIYVETDATIHYTIVNNLFIGGAATYFTEGNSNGYGQLTMDHNDFFGGRSSGPWNWNNSTISTFKAWQAACGCDASSAVGNPNLDASFRPQAGSPAIGVGSALVGLGISALNADKGAQPRGASGPCTPGVSGCWDAGAYSLPLPGFLAPPSGLAARAQ